MTTDDAARRLGEAIRQRRKELKLTQLDVQKMGGPSTATLRLIEGGKHTDFRASTSRPLERALGWNPGSIDLILDGKEPVLRAKHLHPRVDVETPQTSHIFDSATYRELLESLERRDNGEQVDEEEIQWLRDELASERLPSQITMLSRRGRVRVARYTEAVVREELDLLPPGTLTHQLLATEGGRDDIAKSTEAEGGAAPATESQKTHGGVSPSNKEARQRVLREIRRRAVANTEATDEPVAARDTGGISEGEQTRRDMDQQGEAPDAEGPEGGA